MNRDDIIRMSQEAGVSNANDVWLAHLPELIRFANLVAAEVESNTSVYWYEHFLKHFKFQAEVRAFDSAIKAEREACAKVAEEWQLGIDDPKYQTDCAFAIRERGAP